jgi:glutamyl-tRNA reductase
MIQLFSIPPDIPLVDREIILNRNKALLESPGVLLQTCNRTEFYYGDGDVPEDIYTHLFQVVSGLKSNLLGEKAIQGQVKNAYIVACGKYKLSSGLHRLFQRALHVGKKVRNYSGISIGAVSHSQAATEIIIQSGININKAIISIVGVNKLNEDIIRFLKNKGAETFFLANKTFEKAQELAEHYGCEAMRLEKLPQMLEFSDVLITATSAPHLIVKYENFPVNKKLLIIDLAFPSDVDERIRTIHGVQLFNLGKIEQFVARNINLREAEIAEAKRIIEEEVTRFTGYNSSLLTGRVESFTSQRYSQRS